MRKIGVNAAHDVDALGAVQVTGAFRDDTPFGPVRGLEFRAGLLQGIWLCRPGLDDPAREWPESPHAALFHMWRSGVDRVLSTTTVHALGPGLAPGDLVAVERSMDFVSGRRPTFARGPAPVANAGPPTRLSADPALTRALLEAGAGVRPGGTVVTVDGARSATLAENRAFQLLGARGLDATTATELTLAAELGMAVGVLAQVSSQDCWRTGARFSTDRDAPPHRGRVARALGAWLSTLGDAFHPEPAFLPELARPRPVWLRSLPPR